VTHAYQQPVLLPANQPPKFYRGGRHIDEFRRKPAGSVPAGPEDWIASTLSSFGTTDGATRLPDGTMLRDAIAKDPEGYVGSEHLAAYGANPALLVKLLDAGQRLPVHCHPSRAFARDHFGSFFGKTEAWLVLATEQSGGVVHLGFRDSVSPDVVDDWFETQDSAAILAAMNEVPVQAGDAVLVAAGMPHAIGEGIFLVELQEPTDFSVMLEWKGFGIDGARETQLGMPARAALDCMDTSGWPVQKLTDAFVHRGVVARGSSAAILPSAADPFFRAEPVDSTIAGELDAGYAVLVVTDGMGVLESAGQPINVRDGSTVLIPFGAGRVNLLGDVAGVRCRPPAATSG
jgi:mannose-6-phosphate isomerase